MRKRAKLYCYFIESGNIAYQHFLRLNWPKIGSAVGRGRLYELPRSTRLQKRVQRVGFSSMRRDADAAIARSLPIVVVAVPSCSALVVPPHSLSIKAERKPMGVVGVVVSAALATSARG